ncbi:hypothetical protein CROQUDRAFT_657677 [Cronartium quercuum f. sp. fusiforme G11]|uniref:Right handed beta helix domain-containing protein n=1 Tax=Cronartium quercuum f. sp. fusiforme G11 TaxID=708437 RepID=A0A9P6NHR5_9BASI|nr:hypothetical protein CROQUDRAFT_657677 [Cronartium quercuum f. sp. fusiforme G11]
MALSTVQVGGLHPHQIPPEYINRPAAYLNYLFETGGNGTIVLLAQSTLWELESVLKITVNNAELSTFGYPTDPSLHAQIHPINDSEPSAITFYDTHHVKLSHLTIDGKRPEKGWVKDGHALVACGGRNAKEPVVQYCILKHPRGWTCLHVFNHCQGGRVIGNKVGPAGQPAPDGPWADGLSIACKDGIIANNEIVDATDGAIVLFCAPGTICIGNTIIARNQNLLGAINMVDSGPYEMDYTRTRVFGNIIRSEAAHIKLGIGIGPLAWAPGEKLLNFGGEVHDNVFGPGRFGYAIGISGAKNFNVQGNRVVSGTEFIGDMSSMPEPINAPPTAFLAALEEEQVVEDCSLQSDFVRGRARWLIGIEDGPPKKLRYDAGKFALESSEVPGICFLANTRLQLDPDGLLSVIRNTTSETLWTSGFRGSTFGAKLEFTVEGKLEIREKQSGKLVWDPTAYLQGRVELGKASLSISDKVPHLVLWTKENSIAWASEYAFEKGGLELNAGQFICIPPSPLAPPPIPPRQIILPGSMSQLPPPIPPRPIPPTFLYLDPQTSNLVLHQGRTPTEPHGFVLWASEFFPKFSRQVLSRKSTGCETKACFQGSDGNLVIYGNPFDDNPTERTALWASKTNCDWLRVDEHHRCLESKPALSFHSSEFKTLIKKIP